MVKHNKSRKFAKSLASIPLIASMIATVYPSMPLPDSLSNRQKVGVSATLPAPNQIA